MAGMTQLYTLGIWTTHIGSEEAFKAEWEAFAKWTEKRYTGAGTARLLQDPEHPQNFISFGPWENNEAIRSWRELPEFKEFVTRIRKLCVEFQPRTLVLVASSGE